MQSQRDLRALVNALNVRAHSDHSRSVGWMRRALPIWRRVLRYHRTDSEAVHATLASIARISRRRTIHRRLRRFVPSVGRFLENNLSDSALVQRCCDIIRNISTTQTDEVAKIARTLVAAGDGNGKANPSIAVALAYAYTAVHNPLTRVRICEFALKMLESDIGLNRASGVTLLSSVLQASDSRDVLKASDAFCRVRAVWHKLPLSIMWIRPMHAILTQDTSRVENESTRCDKGTTHSEERCCICLDAPTDCTISCKHRFCHACVRTHVSSCIVGNGAECDMCCDATIPRCPLCRLPMHSAEILQAI